MTKTKFGDSPIFDRRHFFKLTGAATMGSLMSACVNPFDASKSAKRPNFLFLSIDDLNDWIGVLGTNANVKTPHIDALAGRGMLFTNAHAQAPICSPSRASLMSGLYPHQTGLYGQIADDKLRGAVKAVSSTLFLTEYLRENGYYTAGRGKLFHQGAPENTFDEYFREGDFGPKPPERMKWESNRTHTDWGPYPATDEQMYDYKTARWGEAWEWRPILQAYLASISFVDHCVGLAVEALRASAYAENTYIILFSDHGYHLGEKSRFAKMSRSFQKILRIQASL